MQKTYAVTFKSVSKKYHLRHMKPALIDTFIRGWDEEFWALKNVSFRIKKGEKLGLIGRNGSGKTTLLKILSGITRQSSGNVAVNGKLVSLIELDAGFHPDLTGRENIFLNGLLIGMTKDEVMRQTEKIIRFAELEHFIDSPLFTYSAGMNLRLGFSIAVHADPDILVLDEGIAVGDERFRKKAKKKIGEFFRQDKTIIVASHWIDFLHEVCTRILWLEHGQIKKLGDKNILAAYKKAYI